MVPCAFVEQDVSFFPHSTYLNEGSLVEWSHGQRSSLPLLTHPSIFLFSFPVTVRETLSFRVELKLGSQISKKSRAELVEDLIAQMRLEKAADTIVGDSKVRGISGGERRRLAIACELISSPSVIFLDEPTTGLDSTAATGVVETLRSLADAGKTVVAVIHQPSQHVFAAFDDLLLVSEGKQMYFGEVANVRQYMDMHVVKAPSEMGTAEHILDCISKAALIGESEQDTEQRLHRLAELARSETVDIGSRDGEVEKFVESSAGPRANLFVQFKLLLHRALRENLRGKAKLVIQIVQQVSLGLIYGGIYTIGTNQVRCCCFWLLFSSKRIRHCWIHKYGLLGAHPSSLISTWPGIYSGPFWNFIVDCHWSSKHGDGIHHSFLSKGKSNHLHRTCCQALRDTPILYRQSDLRDSTDGIFQFHFWCLGFVSHRTQQFYAETSSLSHSKLSPWTYRTICWSHDWSYQSEL